MRFVRVMKPQSVQFNDVIDERVEVMPLHPTVFDQYFAEGWRLLSKSLVRHNVAHCRGVMVRTIPLRIRLEGFKYSKSQRRLLRRNADLWVRRQPIELTPEKEVLFNRHCVRFRERRPAGLGVFLNDHSRYLPVPGWELDVYDRNDLVASSFFHLGEEAMSGTYCFFDPFYDRRSLGTYTMLLELEQARQAGIKYYYHGYCYEVPSQFDYKRGFNNLEYLDWQTGLWLPMEKAPLHQWAAAIEKPFYPESVISDVF